MGFDKREFLKFAVDNGVVGFFDEPITLKSGQESYWYVNWRDVAEDIHLIDKLTDFILDFVDSESLSVDCFYGVPEGATKIGLLCQYKMAKEEGLEKGSHKFSMGRGRKKSHGDPKDRFFLGVPEGRTVVVEDVTTTGGSLIEAVQDLKDTDAEIVSVVCLTDRNQRQDGKTVKEEVEEEGVAYRRLSSAEELLPLAFDKYEPDEDIKRTVKEEVGL